MTPNLILPLAAVVPGLLLLIYFNARQNYHLSADIVWSAVMLGAAASIPAVAMEFGLAVFLNGLAPPIGQATLGAFLGTGLPEEAAKFFVIYWIALRHEDFERPVDALVLSVAVALGFASFENLLYVVQSDDWARTASIRAITAVPSHVVNAMFMGYFLGRAQLARRKVKPLFLALALIVPMLTHGAYDMPLFAIDELNRADAMTPALSARIMLGFAGVLASGSVAALFCWYDLLSRDERDQEVNDIAYEIRQPSVLVQRIESLAWITLGGLLFVGSVSFASVGFIGQAAGGWAIYYPQYFLSAASILPCLFGGAMLVHGIQSLRTSERANAQGNA
ncbi:MAG: PrsW family intramembrane metalloprotease [Pseudomonadota bacterium]